MEIIDHSLIINEAFRECVDAALRKHWILSRTRLMIDHLDELLKPLSSGTQKRKYFDEQIKLINEEAVEALGFSKYQIFRGAKGGYSFTLQYLKMSDGEDYKERDQIVKKNSMSYVDFKQVIESMLKGIEFHVDMIRKIMSQQIDT